MDTSNIIVVLVTIAIFLLGYLVREVQNVRRKHHDLTNNIFSIKLALSLVVQKLGLTIDGWEHDEEINRHLRNGR